MTNALFSTFADNSRFTYESLQELGAINTKTLNRLAEIQMNFARLGIEGSMEQTRLMTDVNSYNDLFSAESSLASSYGDKIMGLVSETVELMTDSRDQLVEWMEKNFEEGKKKATAPAKPKPAAKKTTTTAKTQSKAA